MEKFDSEKRIQLAITLVNSNNASVSETLSLIINSLNCCELNKFLDILDINRFVGRMDGNTIYQLFSLPLAIFRQTMRNQVWERVQSGIWYELFIKKEATSWLAILELPAEQLDQDKRGKLSLLILNYIYMIMLGKPVPRRLVNQFLGERVMLDYCTQIVSLYDGPLGLRDFLRQIKSAHESMISTKEPRFFCSSSTMPEWMHSIQPESDSLATVLENVLKIVSDIVEKPGSGNEAILRTVLGARAAPAIPSMEH